MDIGSILNFAIGAVVALALGWIGWQEWQKASHEQKLETIRRVVLAVEEYAKRTPGVSGVEKLGMAIDRLEELLPKMDPAELDEQIHAVVAELNQSK